ncbi:twin-arginine translocation pathway signal protein [Proteobacteria bacterium 005FR1]|nr:twin-arginine translocation pathway signal protein [Proteobacteria bacterium 005FR1]
MTVEAAQDSNAVSRRKFLKIGLWGTALLTAGGITTGLLQRSSPEPAAGFQVLRASDMPFLQATIPVILAGAVTPQRMRVAVNATLAGIDYNLAHFSPAQRKMALQLFDVLALQVTRGPLTGIWSDWEHAATGEVQGFLERWKHSSIGMVRQGHASLLQLVSISWYGSTLSWEHAGYPGPPNI